MKRARVTIPILTVSMLAVALTVAGCGGGGTDDPSAAPSDGGETTAPTPTETSDPDDEPALAGDCTAADGVQPAIPVIYSVFTGDAVTPVTVSYTSFNLDGTIPATTETVTGPVWTKVGYPCTDTSGGSVWALTATQTTTDAVGCTLAFGGKLVKTASAFAESATPVSTTADCSGNPGM